MDPGDVSVQSSDLVTAGVALGLGYSGVPGVAAIDKGILVQRPAYSVRSPMNDAVNEPSLGLLIICRSSLCCESQVRRVAHTKTS